MSQQLIALEKTEHKPQQGAKWNNHVIKWAIFANHRNYEIVLTMNYLSSKKVVTVNGEQRNVAMVTFGYESSFCIDTNLSGRIKQMGLKNQFQFFINDVSFTNILQKRPTYEPIKIGQGNADFDHGVKTFPTTGQQIHPIKIEGSNIVKKQGQKKIEKGQVNENREISEMQKIKNTQKELLKILKGNKSKG